MLIKQLIKQTVDMQGFCVHSVNKDSTYFMVKIIPDHRYSPRCGQCGTSGVYRDKRPIRLFRHVPLWGMQVWFAYAPRRLFCQACDTILVEQMPWVQGSGVSLPPLPVSSQAGPGFCPGLLLPGLSNVPGVRLPLSLTLWLNMVWPTVIFLVSDRLVSMKFPGKRGMST